MFIESGEIGTMTMKASNLFEKDLCESMRQTSISDFFKKKINFLYTIIAYVIYLIKI